MKQLSIFFNQLIRYKIETGQKTNKYNITTLLNTIGVPVNKRIKHTYLYNISLHIIETGQVAHMEQDIFIASNLCWFLLWGSDCCLKLCGQFFNYIMARTSDFFEEMMMMSVM